VVYKGRCTHNAWDTHKRTKPSTHTDGRTVNNSFGQPMMVAYQHDNANKKRNERNEEWDSIPNNTTNLFAREHDKIFSKKEKAQISVYWKINRTSDQHLRFAKMAQLKKYASTKKTVKYKAHEGSLSGSSDSDPHDDKGPSDRLEAIGGTEEASEESSGDSLSLLKRGDVKSKARSNLGIPNFSNYYMSRAQRQSAGKSDCTGW